MSDIISLADERAARRDLGLEERVARARKARAAAAEAAVRRQAEIRDRARLAVVEILGAPSDPVTVA